MNPKNVFIPLGAARITLSSNALSRYYATVVYRLSVRKHGDDTVSLVLGWGWRLFFALFSLSAVVFHLTVGSLGTPGWVFVALCVLAALYHERWHFSEDEIISESGLLFPPYLRRRRTRPRALVTGIAVRQSRHISGNIDSPNSSGGDLYRRPSLANTVQRGFIQLLLEGEDERWIVTTESLRNGPLVHGLAKELAEALNLPLIEPGSE